MPGCSLTAGREPRFSECRAIFFPWWRVRKSARRGALGHSAVCQIFFVLDLLLQDEPFLRLSVEKLLEVCNMRLADSLPVILDLLARQTLRHLHQLHGLREFLCACETPLLYSEAAQVSARPYLGPQPLPQGVLQSLLLLSVR